MNHSIQSEEIEIPIGFAQSLSCVMSSRICLHVRGFIREQSSQGMFSSPPISPVSGASRNAYWSFGEVGQTMSQGKVHTHSHAGAHVIVSENQPLSEIELRELRTMRVEERKHSRAFSHGHYPMVLDIK